MRITGSGADEGVMEDDEIRLSIATAVAVRTTASVALVTFETGTMHYRVQTAFEENNNSFRFTVATMCGHECRTFKKEK